MQRRIVERNADEPQARRLVFRMGVHMGDVIVESDDILGDGVNVAARLEGIAKPGGVALSGRVVDDVENKLDLDFIDTGFQTLKNIAKPMRVYEVAIEAQAPAHVAPERPDKPSLAVLPFEIIAGDPTTQSFADGLHEDLIIRLSKIEDLVVTSKASASYFAGSQLSSHEIASLLGVTVDLFDVSTGAFQPAALGPMLLFTTSHVFADVLTAIVLVRAYRRYPVVPRDVVTA